MSLESELHALLQEASPYAGRRDELVQVLSTYITDMVNKNTGPLKIDLHFAQLAQEAMRKDYEDHISEMNVWFDNYSKGAYSRYKTESNEVREIVKAVAEDYWVCGEVYERCFFCDTMFDDTDTESGHAKDCIAMRAKKLLGEKLPTEDEGQPPAD
jgi:arabinogalactan endo-1,4-beta-galactosidase